MAFQYEKPNLPEEVGWMDCTTAKEKWQLKDERAVQKYCRENWERIGAYQDRKRGPWHIPETACPPLTQEHLRNFAIAVLKYQNAKQERFAMDPIYAAWCFVLLEQRGYAMPFHGNKRISEDNFLVTDPHGWDLIRSTSSSPDVKAFVIRYLPPTVEITLNVTLFLLQSGLLG